MYESIHLSRLPMPPTSNHNYSIIRRSKRLAFVSSKKLCDYKLEMMTYRGLNYHFIQSAQKQILKWQLLTPKISIHCNFYFHHQRLFTKQDTIKKLDVSNRLKAIHDAIAELLEIDDSSFFEISAAKISIKNNIKEYAEASIMPLA